MSIDSKEVTGDYLEKLLLLYFIFVIGLLSAGCSYVQFVERNFRRCALRPCSRFLAYQFFF